MNPADQKFTVVRVERGTNPLDGLSMQARRRLIVRILCELVAYGESEPTSELSASKRPVSAPQSSEPLAASG